MREREKEREWIFVWFMPSEVSKFDSFQHSRPYKCIKEWFDFSMLQEFDFDLDTFDACTWNEHCWNIVCKHLDITSPSTSQKSKKSNHSIVCVPVHDMHGKWNINCHMSDELIATLFLKRMAKIVSVWTVEIAHTNRHLNNKFQNFIVCNL